MGVGPPSGTVTFLFTDVEGSTRRWEADPEAMRAALVLHDETLRSAIEAHGGWFFKHTGDGVCAAFGSASGLLGLIARGQAAAQYQAFMPPAWQQAASWLAALLTLLFFWAGYRGGDRLKKMGPAPDAATF